MCSTDDLALGRITSLNLPRGACVSTRRRSLDAQVCVSNGDFGIREGVAVDIGAGRDFSDRHAALRRDLDSLPSRLVPR